MIRTSLRLVSVAVLATGAGMFAVGGSDAAETGPTQTATFECTGAAQSWLVPADVHQATFDVFGAAGGTGDDGQPDVPSTAPGLGGHTKATIPVVPGETIQINVGCAGADSGEFGSVAPGGFGGSPGGNGGAGGDLGNGGGGGGSSDVRQAGTGLEHRVMVAGGGGGSGGANDDEGTDGAGGAGGGGSGTPGGDTDNVGGGGAGTPAVNGAGGSIATCQSSGVVGQGGSDAKGGDGGTEPTFGAGGGGGGGYGGGGGGAGCVNGGGGGGGAGFAMAGATSVASEVGVRSGDGQVIVTFAAEIVELQPILAG